MTFQQSIEIAAPAATLFDLTQDYSRRLEWDPFLRSAELVHGATAAGVGVRAFCVAHNGFGMETEYVTFTPPRATAITMTHGPWFISKFAGSWRFDQITPEKTRVSFRYHLQGRPRWLAWLLTPLLQRLFARDTQKRLLALKTAVEQGKLVL